MENITSNPVRHKKSGLIHLAKPFVPPIVWDFFKKITGTDGKFNLGYSTGEEAAQAAKGYDDDNIFKKVAFAARMVRDGKAVYERDSVLFDKIEYSWPLLASLLYVATTSRALRVIDFGGSLGTTFRQNKRFLDSLSVPCSWRVVEQQKFVEIGTREFKDQYLSFYNSIGEARQNGADVVLFGGSLCYVSNPYQVLADTIAADPAYILLDRTPITSSEDDIFAVQYVPSAIYRASFPIRSFNYDKLLGPIKNRYDVLEEWVCDLQADPRAIAMGFLLKRREN